jgi:deazaflavin-dependent oxidoreductase (nitroreductase family)
MPEKVFDLKQPHGISRLALRLPIWLYRIHLGWILGTRFVLLTHKGRKSGLLRHTVIEIVRYDKETGNCVVASGWGTKSDWYRNITADPEIFFQIRNRRCKGIAERLSSKSGGEELVNYSKRHPMAWKELAHFMGIKFDGSEADIQESGKLLPLFLLKCSG